MLTGFHNYQFPKQRVSAAEKDRPKWYANCIDFVISAGMSANDRTEDEVKLNILHGDIPNSFYKKTLNPYNADKEKYLRFPATMRNLDIMSDVIRRYVSEYYKGVHDFIVGANNPDIVLKRDAKLREEIGEACQQAFLEEVQRRIEQMKAEAEANGTPPEELNIQDAMPDPQQFMDDFNNKYIDDESKQGQDVLDYIKSITSDTMIYLSAFFQYVALGECYTYTDVRGDTIIKENVPVIEAYPVPNNNWFVEDFDMFARRMLLSYSQILDMFDDYLDERDRGYLEKFYGDHWSPTAGKIARFKDYHDIYPDICEKFDGTERNLFSKEPIPIHSVNGYLYEVWHVVWRGQARRGILTYVNEMGITTTRVVDESYKLNREAGDISIEWEWEEQIYEGYRIGNRYNAVYPIKARPIAYSRDGKLPYNGIMEVLPNFGKFSIIKAITPYQIMRNIFAYHREMVIAKNKLLILLLPQSLIQDDSEDKIYRMAADGILLVDDSEDANSQKMANIRLLNASMGSYISDITQLMMDTKQEAWDAVDMNAQRYGDIAQSAGVSTTQEAIARSSMGSVIIVQVFDEMRKRDYQRDLDFCKLAFIDGLNTAYFDQTGQRRYISLDVNSFVYSRYSVMVKNDAKESEKLQQLREWAFSAAQNGELQMAKAAIVGDNIAQISATIDKFNEIKQQHEEEMQQAEQMLKQQEIENKIREIQAKGEEDRKLEELKYYHEMNLKMVDIDTSGMDAKALDSLTSQQLAQQAETNKTNLAQQKLDLEREKMNVDTYNRAADRQVKMHDIDTKMKIAKQNKNKYDFK